MLRASPNGQQMLAEFDKAAANGNIVTIRELQNVDNGYAQSVGGSDIRNGQPGNSGPVDISYNPAFAIPELPVRSEEHTSELQSLMRISYAVSCLKKNNN